MKTIENRYLCVLLGVCVLCLATISCSNPTGSDPSPVIPQGSSSGSEPGIYIVGEYLDPSLFPCYWKDGEIVELSTHAGEGGRASVCFNDAGTVRFAGTQDETMCIWTERYRKDIPNTNSSADINAMLIRGADTYLVGSQGYYSAVYWKNGVSTHLTNGSSTNSTEITGIFIDQNSNIHMCGINIRSNPNILKTPIYWKNDIPQELPMPYDEGEACDITMANGHVYIVGYYATTTGRYACYWLDGIRHDLSTSTGDWSYAQAIYIDGSDVYIGGLHKPSTDIYDYHACYWKNGERVELPGTRAYVWDLVVKSGKVYLCGNGLSATLTSTRVGCYWVDGVQHELSSLVNKGTNAWGIVVK